MLFEHLGKRPSIHPSAYIAPTATICGDVTISEGCRVLFGAVVIAEGGSVAIGRETIVMEGAVVRGTRWHPTTIGDHVLIGPHAHITGCTLEDATWVSTGGSVFNGARVGHGSVVAINAVVHVEAILPAGSHVPIGWLAVGSPAEIMSPTEIERFRGIQRNRFWPVAFGIEPASLDEMMPVILPRYTRTLGRHAKDRMIEEGDGEVLDDGTDISPQHMPMPD